MPSAPSSLMIAVVVVHAATGCFLSGDYELHDGTVRAPGQGSEAGSSSENSPSSEALPTTPSSPPEAPSAPLHGTSPEASDASFRPSTSSDADGTSGEHGASGERGSETDSASVLEPPAASGDGSSAPPTSAPDTQGTQTSDGNAWNNEDSCSQGDCPRACSQGEVRGPRERCYWFGAGQGTWNQARTACSARGRGWMPLAIHDEQEDSFVSSHLDPDTQTWLGARYAMGSWRWLDDNSAFWNGTGVNGAIAGVFTKWGTNEPSGLVGATCAYVEAFNGEPRWADSQCTGLKRIACQSPVSRE